MGFNSNKSLGLYSSLEAISIYRFDKAQKGDLRYLSKEEEVDAVELNESYNDVFEELSNSYAKLTKNDSLSRVYLLLGEINYLKLRMNIVPILLDIFVKSIDPKAVSDSKNELKEWGFHLKSNESSEISRVITSLENSSNKLRRKEQEYSDLIDSNKCEDVSLFQQKIKLETAFSKAGVSGVKIDVKKDSVVEWFYYWEELSVLLKNISKNISKNV